MCRLIVSLKQISRRLICFVLEISPCQSGQSATRVAHASHILSMRAFKKLSSNNFVLFFPQDDEDYPLSHFDTDKVGYNIVCR